MNRRRIQAHSALPLEEGVPGDDDYWSAESIDEQLVAQSQTWNTLEKGISQLSPVLRSAVVLRDVQDLSTREEATAYQKRAAENAVRDLTGVKSVVNLVEVKPRPSTVEVKSAIEAALKRSAEVDANHIKVEADGDKVILRGTVRSWAEREEAERAAWRSPGVRSVDNRITVGGLAAAA
jgi:osmotically-inducible protein OsmY